MNTTGLMRQISFLFNKIKKYVQQKNIKRVKTRYIRHYLSIQYLFDIRLTNQIYNEKLGYIIILSL